MWLVARHPLLLTLVPFFSYRCFFWLWSSTPPPSLQPCFFCVVFFCDFFSLPRTSLIRFSSLCRPRRLNSSESLGFREPFKVTCVLVEDICLACAGNFTECWSQLEESLLVCQEFKDDMGILQWASWELESRIQVWRCRHWSFWCLSCPGWWLPCCHGQCRGIGMFCQEWTGGSSSSYLIYKLCLILQLSLSAVPRVIGVDGDGKGLWQAPWSILGHAVACVHFGRIINVEPWSCPSSWAFPSSCELSA